MFLFIFVCLLACLVLVFSDMGIEGLQNSLLAQGCTARNVLQDSSGQKTKLWQRNNELAGLWWCQFVSAPIIADKQWANGGWSRGTARAHRRVWIDGTQYSKYTATPLGCRWKIVGIYMKDTPLKKLLKNTRAKGVATEEPEAGFIK
jgi:hypothetical protein